MRCKPRGKDSLWIDRSASPAIPIAFDKLERVAQNGYFSAVPSISSLDQGSAREGGVPVVVAQFRDLENVAGHRSRLACVIISPFPKDKAYRI